MLEKLPEFVGNHALLSLAFVGVVLALIYTEIARRMRGFAELSPLQLTQLINRDDPAVFDVSAYADYESGHIIGAKHLPPSQIDPAIKPLVGLQDKPVAVYCKTGNSSEQIATKLTKAGFANVSWLKGGLLAWRDAKLPVMKGKTATKSDKKADRKSGKKNAGKK